MPPDGLEPSPPSRAAATPTGQPGGGNTLLGLWYLMISAFSFQGMNAAVRYLSAEMHPFEIAFFRSIFGVLALAPVFLRSGFAPLRTERLGMHLFRGIFSFFSLLTFFFALSLPQFQ